MRTPFPVLLKLAEDHRERLEGLKREVSKGTNKESARVIAYPGLMME